jgi:DNA-binding LacI/PurR family transcriptional regulator
MRVGDQLPPEPELMAQYRVSRSTLREAVASLEHEGLVRRVHGKGTYVMERPSIHRMIAVSMPYLFFGPSSPFSAGTEVIPRLTQSIEEEARHSDISVMLYLSNNNVEIERENLERILVRGVDGVIVNYIGGNTNIDCLRRIQAAGIPLVMIDLYESDIDVDVITTDNHLGAYQATLELLDAGLDTVYFITSPPVNSALRERKAGYLQAMGERGCMSHIITLDDPAISLMNEEQRVYITMRKLLPSWRHNSFGVLTAEAPIMAGLWQAISESALSYHEFMLASFDEPFLLVPDGVRLYKVLQPLQEIGKLSVEHIKEGINKADTDAIQSRIVKLPPKIHREP